MPRVLMLIVLACAVQWELSDFGIAGEKTSVALTTTVSVTAGESERALTANLISLIEVGVLADDSLVVVERQQLDLAIQELALNRSRSADESLQLGKLATADMLVMLELLKTEESPKPAAVLRVVEARTAAILGLTAIADVEETNLEDAAEQFSRYVLAVKREPQAPAVTVAVVPFESVGRFDRLRPLELGVRDLVTARLLWRMGTPARCPDEKEKKIGTGKSAKPPFQVLQRSSLDQLLRELDLIQSGFADQNRLPNTLPERQAAFLVKGEIDERQVDGTFLIEVRGELLDVATMKSRDSFEFKCLPSEVESHLAVRVDRFAMRLGMATVDEVRADESRDGHEAQSLKSLALRDLHRFRRLSPTDFGHRVFRLPGEDSSRGISRLARPDAPLGKALLRKSIDRLESVLFIQPNDSEAAYALGFCYSLHEPGIYQPARADEFLRKVYSSQPQSELAALGLAFLGEIAFHDLTGQLDPAQRDVTAERLWFAFENTPAKFRDHRWPRTLDLFASTGRSAEQNTALLIKVVPYAEQSGEPYRRELAGQVKSLVMRLAHQAKDDPPKRTKGLEVLRRWSEGTDPMLADFGRQGLAAISAGSKDFLVAAMQYEESAMKLADLSSPMGRHQHDVQLVHAAKNYRLAQQSDRGLRLLRSFKPEKQPGSILVGMHGYEIGACLEALGEKQDAMAAYLNSADECPGIVSNSDIVERIQKLGGVPLNEDRDIDVRYLRLDGNRSATNAPLATDGSRLFVGGGGVSIFDLDTETATSLKADLGKVTVLEIRDRRLWVGTDGNGVWRCDLGSQQWKPFGTAQGLPDPHVTSLVSHKNDIYVGIGSHASGGLVRIDESEAICAIDDADAPRSAPSHLVIDDKRLLARTLHTIHERSMESGKWTVHKLKSGEIIAPNLFPGTTQIWASNYGHELTIWDADAATNQFFKPAWYFVPATKAGVSMNFVAERGDEVWFGGQPWDHFVSSGLYRFHKKTGDFQKFSPRDGFKTIYTQSVHDGLWLRDRLWLTTSGGLCVVTPREETPK